MSDDAYVEVTGHGSATTTPDRVRLWLASVAKAPAVGNAFAAADAGLKDMLAAARDHGVADADIRTTQVDVRSGRRGHEPGFRASMGVEITVHDVAAAGSVLAAIVDASGDRGRVERVSLGATASEAALAEARARAWANALDKARQYASLSGRDLGEALRVSEAPQARGYAIEAVAGAADLDSFSIEPGVQTVRVAITARWALT